MPPTSYRSIAVQTTDVGEYRQLISEGARIDGKYVDDQESQDLVTKLQISIRKLENDVDFYAKEMSKYRIYWKNECRLADAAEYGWGGVSQTSWSSSSPHRAYSKCFIHQHYFHTLKHQNPAGNVSEDVEESSATGE